MDRAVVGKKFVLHVLNVNFMLVRIICVVQVCEFALELLEHLDAVVHRRAHGQRMRVLQLAQLKPRFWPHSRCQNRSDVVQLVVYQCFPDLFFNDLSPVLHLSTQRRSRGPRPVVVSAIGRMSSRFLGVRKSAACG
eukprot:3933682-Pleurochrysis_carterae.AAC.1